MHARTHASHPVPAVLVDGQPSITSTAAGAVADLLRVLDVLLAAQEAWRSVYIESHAMAVTGPSGVVTHDPSTMDAEDAEEFRQIETRVVSARAARSRFQIG